jgi:glucose-1-phosphate thymidylyltransferase
MKIVIPTAGYGTRLRPHTWSKPKPLVTVAGKPVLGHVLDMFTEFPDIDEVTFIVGYLGDQIEEYVKSAYPDLPTRYIEQTELIGQSHAIWLAREGLTGPMLMAFVDTIIEADLSALQNEPAGAVGWVKEVPDPRRFGVAEAGEDGWVTRLVEKPEDMSNNLAIVGFYYFQKAEDLISAIEKQMQQKTQLKGEFYLVDAVNIMLDQGLQMRLETVEEWHDCGKPDALLETNRYLLDNGRDNSSEAAKRETIVVVPPVYIDSTAEIARSVIGPYVSIGPGCVIKNSMLQNSIIDANSEISETSLSQSLVGRHARLIGRYRSLNVGDSSEINFA